MGRFTPCNFRILNFTFNDFLIETENMLKIELINISKTPRYGQTLMSGRVLALKNGTSFYNKVDCQIEP